jgi:hypothetical protein
MIKDPLDEHLAEVGEESFGICKRGHPSGASILKPCKISGKGAPAARRCPQTLVPES